ncbi:hypothetical protein LTR17_023744 [Elasticomyces elasticus]|nr:hypothetical protein LTR17_023744 [Elasticomyces elasticus]
METDHTRCKERWHLLSQRLNHCFLHYTPYSSMVHDIAPTERGLGGIKLSHTELEQLALHAQESDAADRKLTIREALKQYKVAVFWAMLLSTSLIMEGFDLVTASPPYTYTCLHNQYTEAESLTTWQPRSTLSMVKSNSKPASASQTQQSQAAMS